MAKLRIVFVTQDDPFYVPVFFDEFFRVFDDLGIELCGTVIQVPLGKQSMLDLAKQMFGFYGPVGFVYMGTRFVTRKLLGVVAVQLFRGRFPGHFSVRHVLQKHDATLLDHHDVNSPAFREFLTENRIDLLVSVAASQKIRPETLDAPTYGCINIHNAKLPKNRGMLPNFWALYHHDTEPVSAMTVHLMNEDLDDGPIVLQRDFELDPQEPLEQLILRTKRENAPVVIEAIGRFKDGPPELLPNRREEATYNTFPTAEDVAAFRKKGLALLGLPGRLGAVARSRQARTERSESRHPA